MYRNYFILCALSFGLWSANVFGEAITVMSYNVENLFDTFDDPRYRDEEFTPEGRAQWTSEKLAEKMDHLAQVVLSEKSASGAACPDVLGIVEVENYQVLKYWSAHYLKKCGYLDPVIHIQSEDEPIENDRRGIKVALLTRIPLAGQPFLHLIYKGTRYILEVNLNYKDTPLTVFVNHWKSRSGGGEEKRIKSANVLLSRMKQIFENDPDHDMIAIGDFNDEPENQSLHSEMNINPSPQAVFNSITEMLVWNTSFNLFYLPQVIEENKDLLDEDELKILIRQLQKERGTYFYWAKKSFNQLDNILITRGLFDDFGFQYKPGSFRVIRHPDFTTKEGGPMSYKTYRADDKPGASDHFPVAVDLVLHNH